MAFRLANVDLLPTFLRSLQQTLLSKHDGSMIVLDETYDLEFGDDIKEDVDKTNLLVEPKIAAEFGFQMQLYKASDSPMAGVLGFCKSNFEDPESAEDKGLSINVDFVFHYLLLELNVLIACRYVGGG